ncbi:MAG: hypothetical protein KAT04_02505 [Methylococcales bacterium]|nr:hypothetical protein [Methylococcales bacterium]
MKYFLNIYILCHLLILAVETQASDEINKKNDFDIKEPSSISLKEESCNSNKTFLTLSELEDDAKKSALDCYSQKQIHQELGIIFKSSPPSERDGFRYALLVGSRNTRILNHNSPGTSFGVGIQYESLKGYETTFILTQFQDINPQLIDTDRLRFWHEGNIVITKDFDFFGYLAPVKWLTTKVLAKVSAAENTPDGQEFNFKYKAGFRFTFIPFDIIKMNLDTGVMGYYLEYDDDHVKNINPNRGRSNLYWDTFGAFLDPSLTVQVSDKLNAGILSGILFDNDGTILETNASLFINYELVKFKYGNVINLRLSESYQGFSKELIQKFDVNTNNQQHIPITDVDNVFKTDLQLVFSF